MNLSIHNQNPARSLRLLICAALACAITGVTAQVIISSANQLDYRVAATSAPPTAATADAGQPLLVASAS
jgi:hypothetical protein